MLDTFILILVPTFLISNPNEQNAGIFFWI